MNKLHQDSWNNINKIIIVILEFKKAKAISRIWCLWGQQVLRSKNKLPQDLCNNIDKIKIIAKFLVLETNTLYGAIQKARMMKCLDDLCKKNVCLLSPAKCGEKEPSLREIKLLTLDALRIFSTKTFEAKNNSWWFFLEREKTRAGRQWRVPKVLASFPDKAAARQGFLVAKKPKYFPTLNLQPKMS